MPYLPFKRPSRIAIRPRQSIRHDPPPTGVEKKSLWSSSFHCTRAFLAVNEKRGGGGGPGAAGQRQRRGAAALCRLSGLAQSAAGLRVHARRTTPHSTTEAALFAKRSRPLLL